jgi:ergothioneine biosynthesis protein EgtB
MTAEERIVVQRDPVRDRLLAAWRRSDEIFGVVSSEAMYSQPIRLRHPIAFYVGHLPAFAWNQVCRGLLGLPGFRAELDDLFERGIDPVGVDCHDAQVEWPAMEEILGYRDRVRSELLSAVHRVAELADREPLARRDRIWSVVIEHELMHQETLQYMFQQLPPGWKRRPPELAEPRLDGAAAPGVVSVSGGPVTLGADFDAVDFGWDNEFPELRVEVADFAIDRTPVRNAELLEFLRDGGYRRPELWTEQDWAWRDRTGLLCPVFWSREGGEWYYHAMFDRLSLDRVGDWPVYVSLAEARAYCRWKGARLATEPELHRAAYSTPDGALRPYPWGDAPPDDRHGTFDFNSWAPTPVGSHPDGYSAWGVAELVGNGWEWTATPFAPFPGFRAYIPTYPGYSADFFDGRHYVMLGASWATPVPLIRRSFRNWFQDHYPYAFAKFRCARDA